MLSDGKGRASQAKRARDAAKAAERAKAAKDAAKRRFMLLPPGEDDSEMQALVEELTREHDEQEAEARRLKLALGGITVDALEILRDGDLEALPAKRALIRSIIASATVSPGRGPVEQRVSIEAAL